MKLVLSFANNEILEVILIFPVYNFRNLKIKLSDTLKIKFDFIHIPHNFHLSCLVCYLDINSDMYLNLMGGRDVCN